METKQVLDNLIFLALYGSHAYGMADEQSDHDYRGVCIPPKEYILGTKRFEQKDSGWNNLPEEFSYLSNDTVIYSIQKFIKLATDCNPNIIEQLFLDDYLYMTPIGERLIENRDLFLSTKARWTYTGYAYSQIKRIETHRKWLLDPPQKKPEPEDYGLKSNHVDNKKLKDEVNAFLTFLYNMIKDRLDYIESMGALSEQLEEYLNIDYRMLISKLPYPEDQIDYIADLTGADTRFVHLVQIYGQYQNDLKRWNAYQDWKHNRNAKRRALEEKCGYDAKHAAQCVRLMRMGKEILEQGTIIVDRRKAGDADELLAIKRGDVPYEVILEETEVLDKEMKELYSKTKLPKKPRVNEIERLLIAILERHMRS